MLGDMRQMTAKGRAIEDKSFAIIDDEVGMHAWQGADWTIVRRVIHATADFEFKELMQITADAVDAGVAALNQAANIIVDVNMIASGLSEQRLSALGCRVHCFINDTDVITRAKEQNSTRATIAMRKARDLGLIAGSIIAVGNAPTALLELCRIARDDGQQPALVIGVPVGFVSAAESKEELAASAIPSIITSGRKGGSPIAVAIIHALMMLAGERASL